MASLIPGFEYDIFISYRQKDNKHDGWVTEFVDNLKGELESTFKEEVSVYFDINPHDGLLETHDVDASLKDKLKCFVFIPIISRTYCDPKSFAWEHEFKAFVELASEDQFGLKIKLPNGNVANRVLPIRIYDLDNIDIKLCESVLGGVMRGVEFIYKEPGVNRPLKPDDDEKINLNKTKYRNQINKVANSIKEIITALEQNEQTLGDTSKDVFKPILIPRKSNKTKIIAGSIIALALIVLGFLFIPKFFQSDEQLEKSIAVLPFENKSNDPEQEDFCDGIMQEILNHLFMIEGLQIPSSTSSMRFKGSKLSVREIARKLNVSYLLEGNVSRSTNNVRIIVRLVNGRNEKLLWAEDYKRILTATNLLEIQSDVAQKVAENLNVAINSEVKKRIEDIPTKNTEAYTLYLQWVSGNLKSDQVVPKLERAISLDPGYADAYAGLAIYWAYEGGHGGSITREQVLEKAEPLLTKALALDKNSLLTHFAIATIRLYYYWDFESVKKEYIIVKQLGPTGDFPYSFFSDYLVASGEFEEAFNLTKKQFDLNKNSSGHWIAMALAFYYIGEDQKALETIETAQRLFPGEPLATLNFVRIFTYLGKYREAIGLFEKSFGKENLNNIIPFYLGLLGIAYFNTGEKIKSAEFLNELISRSKNSPVGSPSFFSAAICTAMGENDKALQSLEKAYADREVEMYWLKVEPLFRSLHGAPRFENLLTKIGFKD
jgi:TolB-like protein